MAADAADRGPAAIVRGPYVTVAIGASTAAQQRIDDYCRAYYGRPCEFVGLIQSMIPGTLAEVVDRLLAYVDAGASHRDQARHA